ncbi:MAG: hypothetical protein NTZ78_04780 [Candidatus Aureabacteria bacterium]|nr:hypothetical protein [Candidatus Auribacterota bacterium]
MKQNSRIVALILIPFFLTSCASGPLGGARINIVAAREGRVAELPKGMQIKTVLDDTLSSASAHVGQKFSVSAVEGISSGDIVVIPAGTKIHGSVTKIKPPSMGLMKAKIEIQFESISLNGRNYRFPGKTGLDINAYAKTGATQLGEAGAKKAIKYFIPVMGQIFMVMDVCKAAQTVTEDKQIRLEQGSHIIVQLTKPVRIPLG